MRLFAALLLLVSAVFAERPLWVAIGPKELLEELTPLVEHRKAQGLDARLVEWKEGARPLEPRPDYLLIVGDFDREGEPADWTVPTTHVPFYRWRKVQPQTFATDAPLADADGDGYAEFPVGRIPAREPAQVATVVGKILAYETRAARLENLTLAVWAGASGYGDMMDAMQTGMLVTTVRDHAPKWMAPWMISSHAKQPLCGWPPDQPRRFVDRMRRGTLLNAAVAHGNADGIYAMKHDGKGVWLHSGHAAWIAEGDPAAPLVLLACNCGEFDRSKPSFGERMLFAPAGPVAAVGATTESHPMTNYFTGVALLKALDGKYGRRTRLGDLWLEAQRHAATERNLLMENMLKEIEGKLEAQINVERLREDQQRLYALLGDPALVLPLPETLEATVTKNDAGWTWTAPTVEGATALHVAFRPAKRKTVLPAAVDDADGRRARFDEANAAEGFATVTMLKPGRPWTGKHDQPGLLRLVAVTPRSLHVAVLELK